MLLLFQQLFPQRGSISHLGTRTHSGELKWIRIILYQNMPNNSVKS